LNKIKALILSAFFVCLGASFSEASIKQIYISSGSGVSLTSGLDTFATFNGSQNLNTTETNKEQYLRVNGGTYSHLAARISANTLDQNTSVKFRKNGATGNQVVTITAATTGLFQDTSNTDVCATDDRIAVEYVVPAASGSATLNFSSVVSSPSSNYRIYSKDNGGNIAGTGIYISLVGGGTGPTDDFHHSRFRVAGTLKKAQVTVSANTSVSDNTLSIWKNNALGNIAVVITALTTGRFEDTAGEDSITSTDFVSWKGQNTGNTITATVIAVEFSSNDAAINEIIAHINGAVSDGATLYANISGQANGAATELLFETPIDFDYTASKLETHVRVNATTSASTLSFRVGAASPGGVPSITITAGTTGFFSDLSSEYTGASGDLVDYRIVNGGGGSLTIGSASMLMNEVQATGFAHSFVMIF